MLLDIWIISPWSTEKRIKILSFSDPSTPLSGLQAEAHHPLSCTVCPVRPWTVLVIPAPHLLAVHLLSPFPKSQLCLLPSYPHISTIPEDILFQVAKLLSLFCIFHFSVIVDLPCLLSLKFLSHFLFVCMCVHMYVSVHAMACMWKTENSINESVLSFFHGSPRV